jgi:predicted metal-dependent peptidase
MPSVNEQFEALELAARRQKAEEEAFAKIGKARGRMLMEPRRDPTKPKPTPEDYGRSAFFAHITLQIQPKPCWDIPTMSTDGKFLYYNPEFVTKQTDDHLYGIHAHEDAHIFLGHHLQRRMGDRDHTMWNVACDLAINNLLVKSGYELPKEALFAGKGPFAKFPKEASAEEYYELLKQEQRPPMPPQPDVMPGTGGGEGGDEGDDGEGEGEGEGKGPAADDAPDPGKCGGIMPNNKGKGSQSQNDKAVADHKMVVAAAAHVARQRGTLPSGLDGIVAEQIVPRPDPWEILREFIDSTAMNDFKMPPVDRRVMVASGHALMLPTMESDELGEVLIAWDASGSLFTEEEQTFVAENVMGILSLYEDVTMTVLYHDCGEPTVHKWQRSDGPLRFKPVGGGGTSHVPVFNWVEKNRPDCKALICITDLETEFPPHAPPYPVLWCTVSSNQHAPFGRIVDLTPGIPGRR